MRPGKRMYQFQEIYPDIYCCPVPMPDKKLGPVNVYFFRGACATLLDTGNIWGSKPLRQALAGLGLTFDDLEQIVISHGHFDHYGAALPIKKTASKPITVMAGKEDRKVIEAGHDVPEEIMLQFIILMGVPYIHRHMLRVMSRILKRMGSTCPVDRVLQDGDTIALGSYRARVISAPGHTRGSIVLYLPRENILFSGDHILEHLSPNALVMLEADQPLPRRSSQKEFFASLRKIEELKPGIIFPGHGKPIHNLTPVLEKYENSFRRRQNRILEALSREETTAFQMVKKIFPRLNKLYLFLDVYLAVSEVYSHLQVLEEEGKVRNRTHQGRLLFRRA